MSADFDLVELVDNEDGTMTLRVDMSADALKVFAGIGLIKTITEAAEKAIKDGHIDAEGAGDPESGTGGGGPVSRELP